MVEVNLAAGSFSKGHILQPVRAPGIEKLLGDVSSRVSPPLPQLVLLFRVCNNTTSFLAIVSRTQVDKESQGGYYLASSILFDALQDLGAVIVAVNRKALHHTVPPRALSEQCEQLMLTPVVEGGLDSL